MNQISNSQLPVSKPADRAASRQPPRISTWLEERTGLGKVWEAIFLRRMPARLGWSYTLGSATLFVFGVQVLTGMFLAMYYSPSPDHAYDSVQYIMTEVTFGSVVRGLHHWGASAMVVLAVLHMIRVFAMGAYKFPREVTWALGVVLLLLTLGFGFTGYLLPWDEKAYWATTVGTNIAGLAPGVGGFVLRLVRGGGNLGALTLTRFFAVHTLLLPAAIVAMIVAHLYLVIRHGISAPPDAAAERVEAELADQTAALPPASRRAWTTASPQARLAYTHRYAELKRQGKPFFPDILFKDAIVVAAVLLLLLGLIVWRGVPTESSADPTNNLYLPRPEWYFMFIFEFLKYVPGEFEGLAAVGLPTVLLLLLFLWPFMDRSPARHPRLRPFAMSLMILAMASVIVLTARAFQSTPPAVAQAPGERLTAAQQAGRSLFHRSCSSCHTVDGSGTASGPDLGGLSGRRESGWVHTYIENPKSANPSAAMPAFLPPLSHQEVEMITTYLMILQGEPEPAPSSIQEVRITAYQFGFGPDTFTVTAGLPVRLIITSRDVDHGLAIPGLEITAQIKAGRTTTIEFTPMVPGEYPFECAVYCGTGHQQMRGLMIVQ